MDYSSDKPFKNREHILWEVGYCNKAANYLIALASLFLLLGIISNLFSMKLALDSTSWFMVSIVSVIMSLPPTLHSLLAKHLLGIEIMKKEQTQ